MSVLTLRGAQIPRLRRRLLAWFASRKRDLPWRRTRDPYRIWVSEIMLQQTRVAAVIPYYQDFLAKFPTLEALARARSETVLKQWAGLGYYSRARNLHRAAKEILRHHGGQFPPGYAAALDLPGIGKYTAAAVLSIAYGEPLAVLDGNVARVLARLGAVRGEVRAPAVWRGLENTAQDLLDPGAPGDWNQAMMELGATICTPKSPRCKECPAARWCRARELGLVSRIPAPRKMRASVRVALAAAVLLDARGRTLLVRQDHHGGALFSRMWQFPAVEVATDATSELAGYLREHFKFTVNGGMKAVRSARHAVTFRDIHLLPFLIRVAVLPRIEGARTCVLGRFDRLPISNATRKIARAALADLAKPGGG